MVEMTASERLAEFARARDQFLEAMRAVPEAAVGYLRPGDEYSVGGITVHVNYFLEHYTLILRTMVAGAFDEFGVEEPPELERAAHERARQSLAPDQAEAELAETVRRLEQLVREVEALGADAGRKAAVWYAGSTAAFPTSAEDIVGWLADHYREHVPQVRTLVSEVTTGGAEALAVVGRFNQAFARGDVDGVMALMTEDCVFENTYPPPDGERHVGQADVRAFWTRFFAETPSARWETEEMFAAADRVVARWKFSWGGAEPGHIRGVDVMRVRDGKVAEKLSYVKG